MLPIKRLDFPAPRRMLVPTDAKHYHSAPWEPSAVLSVIQSGGFFLPGQHDFAPGVAEFAATAQETFQELVS